MKILVIILGIVLIISVIANVLLVIQNKSMKKTLKQHHITDRMMFTGFGE